MRIAAVALLLALAACSVDLEGARCQDDTNCPSDQRCDTGGRCVACVSDPNCVSGCSGSTLIRCYQNAGSCRYSVSFKCNPGCSSCECPPNGTGIYYADATSGSGPFVPSGVVQPQECRYATLTGALGIATAGARVIAVGETPMVFTANETFPLDVPSGVTLTTADATPTPVHYVIEVGQAGSTRPAVRVHPGGTVSGFTVRPSVSSAASDAVLVDCNLSGSGTAAVSSMLLDGKFSLPASAIGNGLHLKGQCAVNASAVTAQYAAQAGMLVESSGNVNVSITGSTIRDNGDTGLQVRLTGSAPTPTLTITGNEIKNNKTATPVSIGGTTRSVGGILFFGTPPTPPLTFTSNNVSSNKGDQVMVAAPGTNWKLAGGDTNAACGTTANSISCYDTNSVGLSTDATVNAVYNSWKNPQPSLTSDYLEVSSGSVDVSGYCGQANVTCP